MKTTQPEVIEYRVERGAEVKPGVWAYRIPSLDLEGQSHQPLLDACRKIKAVIGDPKDEMVAIYRTGVPHPYWDMRCSLADGANTTTTEPNKGRVHFVKYAPFKGV